jgi:hypothetical protein
LTLAVLLLPGAAWAPPAETATLTMVSDPGDYIGQGQTWSYDTAAGDVISATATGNRSTVNVAVTGFNETWCFEQHCEGGDPALRGTLAISTTRRRPNRWTSGSRWPGTGPSAG